MKTKDKILLISIELFNKHGVAATTTNHIAKELNISPGNLYFHFENKEEIIFRIFTQMCEETYKVWRSPKTNTVRPPLELIEKNYELFWKYRFLHREIYYLRRKDVKLSKKWKKHMLHIKKLMAITYKRWTKKTWMKELETKQEQDFITNILLATASSFMQFFENSEKLPAKRHIELGSQYVAWLLFPLALGEIRADFQNFIQRRN